MAARISATLLRTQPDRRLAALAADGSEPAFEALVDRYRRPLQAYCRRLLLPRETAEDVVQQALLSTWQALGRGTEIRDVRAWLYRVTHNAALNALRRTGYRFEELSEALSGDGAPDEDLERRTAVRQTLAGLAQLPELQREALLRTAVEGHSHEEVARELGLTDGAVRGLVYRARATLRTAASVLVPGPAVAWAASAGGRGGPMAERVAELVAGGGGTAGVAAMVAKGGATVAAAGALAGGAVVVSGDRPADRGDARASVERSVGDPAGDDPSERTWPGSVLNDPEALVRQGQAAAAAELRRDDAGRGRGSGRGRNEARRSEGRRDSSGPGPSGAGLAGADRATDRSGSSSGSGSGRDDDDDDEDRSGPSGDDDGSSGSGSSGSGSDSSGSGSGGDDGDSSGSGSGSSGSGDDSSGSGSSGSGSTTTTQTTTTPSPTGDSSGSGSSGSGDDEDDED